MSKKVNNEIKELQSNEIITSKKQTNSKKSFSKKNIKPVLEKEKQEINKKEVVVEETTTINESKKKKNKRPIIVLIISLIVLIGMLVLTYFNIFKNGCCEDKNKPIKPVVNKKLPKLPKPEVTEGERGLLGIDKNVNEKAIDKYLNRDDSVYRDMRMLEDPAQYENIGGDRFLSGYVKGFEIVPLPYIIPVKNLPNEVGTTYQGSTLFFQTSDGTYHPMYEESMKIVEKLFPKDKIIFLMCGGGGYAGMMKEFLVSQGWDKDSIYVVGGYWYYKGKNNIIVPKEVNQYGYPEYDFTDVPYHEIDFSELTQIMPDRHNKGTVIPFYLEDEYYNGKDEKFDSLLKDYNDAYENFSKEHKDFKYEEYEAYQKEYADKVINYLHKLMKDKKSFVITVYNDIGCGDDDDTIRTKALDFFEKNHIYTYDFGYELLMKTDIYKDVQNAPNCIIFKNGKVYTYYYDESDDDLKINESKESTAKWIQKYILLK